VKKQRRKSSRGITVEFSKPLAYSAGVLQELQRLRSYIIDVIDNVPKQNGMAGKQ